MNVLRTRWPTVLLYMYALIPGPIPMLKSRRSGYTWAWGRGSLQHLPQQIINVNRLFVGTYSKEQFDYNDACMYVITKFNWDNFNKTAIETPDSSTATATAVQILRTALISVTCVLVMMSALIFLIGFVCDHCFNQKWRRPPGKMSHDESQSNLACSSWGSRVERECGLHHNMPKINTDIQACLQTSCQERPPPLHYYYAFLFMHKP